MILTDNQLNQNPYFTERTDTVGILLNPDSVNLFDQNGYHLTKAEQVFLDPNGYRPVERRHEDCLRYDWIKWNKKQGAHINHSDLFERKGFKGDAKQQLLLHADANPMLYKLVKMKPKWGIDISIDYVSKDNVFEVFHYEWDSFDFNKVIEKKKHIENFVLSKDWDQEAEKLLEIKDQWYHLPFLQQTEWRTNYFGLEPENFKNVIWEN